MCRGLIHILIKDELRVCDEERDMETSFKTETTVINFIASDSVEKDSPADNNSVTSFEDHVCSQLNSFTEKSPFLKETNSLNRQVNFAGR